MAKKIKKCLTGTDTESDNTNTKKIYSPYVTDAQGTDFLKNWYNNATTQKMLYEINTNMKNKFEKERENTSYTYEEKVNKDINERIQQGLSVPQYKAVYKEYPNGTTISLPLNVVRSINKGSKLNSIDHNRIKSGSSPEERTNFYVQEVTKAYNNSNTMGSYDRNTKSVVYNPKYFNPSLQTHEVDHSVQNEVPETLETTQPVEYKLKPGVQKDDYLDRTNEVRSRIMELRYKNNLSPDKRDYTPEEAQQMIDKMEDGQLKQDLDRLDSGTLAGYLNYMASNNKYERNDNLAKLGKNYIKSNKAEIGTKKLVKFIQGVPEGKRIKNDKLNDYFRVIYQNNLRKRLGQEPLSIEEFLEPDIDFGNGGFGGAGAGDSFTTKSSEDYNQYESKKPIIKKESFSEAFSKARKNNQKTFIFDGKEYNTNLSDNPKYIGKKYQDTVNGVIREVYEKEGDNNEMKVMKDSTRLEPYIGQQLGLRKRDKSEYTDKKRLGYSSTGERKKAKVGKDYQEELNNFTDKYFEKELSSENIQKLINKNNRIPYLEVNPNIIGDSIIAGANIGNSIASYFTNKKSLNKLQSPKEPIYLNPVKYKTRININPQLSAINEEANENLQSIKDNTKSSKVALNRMRQVQSNKADKLVNIYGKKENAETELINKNIESNAATDRYNNALANDYINRKADFENKLIEAKGENTQALIQNLAGSVSNFMNSINKNNSELRNIAALAAGYENVSPELLKEKGISYPMWLKQRRNKRNNKR